MNAERFELQAGDVIFVGTNRLIQLGQMCSPKFSEYTHVAVAVDGSLIVEAMKGKKASVTERGDWKSTQSNRGKFMVLRTKSISANQVKSIETATAYYIQQSYGLTDILGRKSQQEGQAICSGLAIQILCRAGLLNGDIANSPQVPWPANLAEILLQHNFEVALTTDRFPDQFSYGTYQNPILNLTEINKARNNLMKEAIDLHALIQRQRADQINNFPRDQWLILQISELFDQARKSSKNAMQNSIEEHGTLRSVVAAKKFRGISGIKFLEAMVDSVFENSSPFSADLSAHYSTKKATVNSEPVVDTQHFKILNATMLDIINIGRDLSNSGASAVEVLREAIRKNKSDVEGEKIQLLKVHKRLLFFKALMFDSDTDPSAQLALLFCKWREYAKREFEDSEMQDHLGSFEKNFSECFGLLDKQLLLLKSILSPPMT